MIHGPANLWMRRRELGKRCAGPFCVDCIVAEPAGREGPSPDGDVAASRCAMQGAHMENQAVTRCHFPAEYLAAPSIGVDIGYVLECSRRVGVR